MRQRGFVGIELILVGLAVAAVLGYIAFLHVRLSGCRADLAEFRRAYDVLSVQVQTQAGAMAELEAKGKEAAQRGATARVQAQPVVEAAQKSADALAGAMRGMRPAECPTKGAVDAVRADLAGK
jgi:cell division septum initiation protein DivIVA